MFGDGVAQMRAQGGIRLGYGAIRRIEGLRKRQFGTRVHDQGKYCTVRVGISVVQYCYTILGIVRK